MKISVTKLLSAANTKAIRERLKAEGLKVKRCRLGGTKQYAMIHTNDNVKAAEIIEEMGYTLDAVWASSREHHPDQFPVRPFMIHLEVEVTDHFTIQKGK